MVIFDEQGRFKLNPGTVHRAGNSEIGLWSSGSSHVFQWDWHLGW